MSHQVTLSIIQGDIVDFYADAVVFKYAQGRYGADRAVARALSLKGLPSPRIEPEPGGIAVVRRHEGFDPRDLIFIGTNPLQNFSYPDIARLGEMAIAVVGHEIPGARSVALNLHGPGFGLDELEASRALVAGLLRSLAHVDVHALHLVSIVEVDPKRAERVAEMLHTYLKSFGTGVRNVGGDKWSVDTGAGLVPRSFESTFDGRTPAFARDLMPREKVFGEQAHVFVAMPFSKNFEDTFRYGIQKPINDAKLLCERMDQVTFTGDIVSYMKSKIETAIFVVADLTGGNANVYLEVGYAWGVKTPTILLAKETENLLFDVRGQRCLIYENIGDLEKKLTQEISSFSDRR